MGFCSRFTEFETKFDILLLFHDSKTWQQTKLQLTELLWLDFVTIPNSYEVELHFIRNSTSPPNVKATASVWELQCHTSTIEGTHCSKASGQKTAQHLLLLVIKSPYKRIHTTENTLSPFTPRQKSRR
jgi:hypothetical protein